MSQDQSAKADCGVKSMPCIDLMSEASSDDQSSFKSLDASAERDGDKPIEKRPSVKSLVDRYGLIEQKLRSAKSNNFAIKKKSFSAACEQLRSSYNDCANMEEGDTQRVENVETFVKNHVYEVFNITTTHQVPQQNKNISENKRFDFDTGMPEADKVLNDMGNSFWEEVVRMIKLNRDYYDCLTQVLDTRKFQKFRDVRLFISSESKRLDQLGFVETEITSSFKKTLEKFSNMLDMELNEELPKRTKLQFLSYRTKVSELRNELENTKKNTRIAEINIKLLQKEKKDLLNILESYNTENVHNVIPLEKRLKSEQEKHTQLQAMVTTIFKDEMPLCVSQGDKLDYPACRSNIYDSS